jgi:hypothetical protein
METFKQIPLFPEYQAGSLGSIKDKNGKIIKGSLTRGYLRVIIKENGVKKRFFAHRLVAQAFIKNPNSKPFINHINGIRNDNRVENLEWCTAKENVHHAINSGFWKDKVGIKCNMSKLTENQVIEIRKLKKTHTHKELSLMFKVAESTISYVVNKKTWAHL